MIYEKIGDVFWNNLGSVFNPNYIAALPNIPNIIHHPIPCSKQKSCFTPHSVVTQPKMKTSGEEKTPIFPPLRPPNHPPSTPQPTNPPTNPFPLMDLTQIPWRWMRLCYL